ncbi:MAG: hypothetical protein FIB02_02730 [Desulfuromonas sp.]|nr:hypothetical protein [Desulfuromonas sp.]
MIIGFAGKAASGKTTAARHLQSRLSGEARIVPMAMVLRDEVEGFLRTVGADSFVPLVHGSQEDKVRFFHIEAARAQAACRAWAHYVEEHHDIQDRPGMTTVTVRRLLQWWGTEYRRAQDPDYWTKAWGRKVEQYDLTRTHILVDDVRFMNELEVVRAHGGLIVKIERPGFAGANNHSSETSLDDYHGWNAVVINDGTLDEFLEKIGSLDKALRT